MVVLSTAATADAAAYAERIGAKGFIIKPFDITLLLEVVQATGVNGRGNGYPGRTDGARDDQQPS